MSDRIPAPPEIGDLPGLLLRHLDSAYNLARWLVRNDEDAEDVVQESYLRAFRHSGGFRGSDARAWLLTIVRNTSYSWLRKTRAYQAVARFDEEIHTGAIENTSNPEHLLLQDADGRLVAKALSMLPARFREILVLRELENLSYKEISDVMGVPIGTVMSTLSRARDRLRQAGGDLLTTHLSPQSGAPSEAANASVPAASGGVRASIARQQSGILRARSRSSS
jgi:RNA polymerase sigma-70 factor (ECF subfamily)